MIVRYVSKAEKGDDGTRSWAFWLWKITKAAVIGIEYCNVPAKYPCWKTYDETFCGEEEVGYSILVDTAGYGDREVPDIRNMKITEIVKRC